MSGSFHPVKPHYKPCSRLVGVRGWPLERHSPRDYVQSALRAHWPPPKLFATFWLQKVEPSLRTQVVRKTNAPWRHHWYFTDESAKGLYGGHLGNRFLTFHPKHGYNKVAGGSQPPLIVNRRNVCLKKRERVLKKSKRSSARRSRLRGTSSPPATSSSRGFSLVK